jgi:hypothetical protein
MTSLGLPEPAVDAAPEASAADDAVLEAPAVLRMLWADPQHMAERIAVWSLARFGPRAASAVESLRAQHPSADAAELERLVVERQTRVAMTEGAFVGGPFIVLIPVAFCAALLAQAQMVFELAAATGRNPKDERRAAELLVLLGAYRSTDEAAAALASIRGTPPPGTKRLPTGTRVAMVRRMAYMLEILAPADPTRGRLREIAGWLGIGVLFLVGLVLPLVWVPYMAYSSRRATLRMGARARGFYAQTEQDDAGVVVRRGEKVEVGGTVAFARMALLVVFPIVFAVVGLLTSFTFVGNRWLTAVVVLLAASALATLAWFGYRTWRRRRRSAR